MMIFALAFGWSCCDREKTLFYPVDLKNIYPLNRHLYFTKKKPNSIILWLYSCQEKCLSGWLTWCKKLRGCYFENSSEQHSPSRLCKHFDWAPKQKYSEFNCVLLTWAGNIWGPPSKCMSDYFRETTQL